MSNGLKRVNELLNYMEEFSNKTGGKEPVVFIGKAVLEEIQSDLQRLDVIDNAKPSEALESLEYLDKTCGCFATDKEYEAVNTIKQTLLKSQEREIRDQKIIEYIEFGWKKYKDEFNKDKSE